MKTLKPTALKRHPIAHAVAACVACLAAQAHATIVDGVAQTVTAPGDPAQTWQVLNGGSLTVEPGAATNFINVETGSTLSVNGATVGATLGVNSGIQFLNTSGTIANSTISSIRGSGVVLGAAAGSTIAPVVTITNSTVSGVQFGATVGTKGTLTITNSTLTSTGTTAFLAGLANFDSTLVVTGGSVSGLNGIWVSTGTNGVTSTTTLSGTQVTGNGGPGILIQPQPTVPGPRTVTVDIENGTTITGSDGNVIKAVGDMTSNVSVDNSQLTGNVTGDGTAVVNLTLQNNASLTGSLVNLNSLAVNSGGKWILTANNTVPTVTMNAGTIDISGTAAGTGTYHTLTLGTLSGNGEFLMGTNIAAHTGDLLAVTGAATGNYQLHIANTGAEPSQIRPLTVVTTGGGGAAFSLVGGKVDAGVYSYDLRQDGNNWVLMTDPHDPGDPGGPDLTPGAQTVIGISGVAPSVWAGEQAILRSRLGDVRLADQSNSGVWVRTFGKQFHATPVSGVDYRQTQYGVMGGADAVVGKAWGGTWLVGGLLGTSHSKLSFDGGSTGGVNSYTAGLYGTWLGSSGYYFETVVRYNHFQNDANVIMSDGEGAHGSFGENSVGATFEFGRHMKFNDDWFVEPYAHLALLRVGGDDFTLTNGMQSNTAHTGSVQLRVGAAFGKTLSLAGGGQIQPYLKLALVQEFIKSNQVVVNGIGFNNDLSGTRFEFGAGVVGQVRRNLQIYSEVESSVGRNINQPWGVQLGVRYTF
ncbi:autotransporter outer membrane beta-barrel domain-containing protein [Pandoraea sputorum]|uniref:Putative autotransporter n=1 Tax=Pandoraea sputorum TaxID=93222 RepID=A0A5E5B4F3_9BURK|nr:autotransporter outer membrane beta-barrel domain-containing protein [Pandoraea sputorum]VVE80052.1 putative autotransporter [Pandoraea sputorum]